MNRSSLVSNGKIKKAREFFFSRGTVPAGMLPELILRSWQRSAASGVSEGHHPKDLPALSSKELAALREENSDLVTLSLPAMKNLYEQIICTSSKVVLADANGVVLHTMGDPDFLSRARKVSLIPGGVWSEAVRGTNAIGTALLEQAPVVVHSGEHFMAANQLITCSAAPICDPYGHIRAVLNVSGDGRSRQQHTMALVRVSAQQIENQMFTTGFEEELVVHFHHCAQLIGTPHEGIAVFSQNGLFLTGNRYALAHLGLTREMQDPQTFASLFNAPLSAALAQGNYSQPMVQLRSRSGMIVYCRSDSRLINASSKKVSVHSRRNPSPQAERTPVLEDLELGDPTMQKVIAKTRKVLWHDIPLLIQGESGTGKELFARAVHGSGPRQNGPFVALNCAALPETLIESELFGYQEGAFTGAKRNGYEGKIRQADGGTLFLDEIGDMPLQLQARLLRVLQERTVSPLGGNESYQVDFALICATNRNLREEATAGRFREDLYYRLNGLLVTLPGLREREDRLGLARKILNSLTTDTVIVSEEAVTILHNHPWPGNIRQMYNVLRTAVVLLGGETVITPDHFPDDFLDQYRPTGACAGADAADSPEAISLDDIETLAVQKALEEFGGNIAAAARKLGVSRNTVYRKRHKQVAGAPASALPTAALG